MDFSSILYQQLYKFFFVLFRILLLFFLFPFFSPIYFPLRIKIFIALILALIITPAVNFKLPQILNIYHVTLIFFNEFLLIFIISLIFRFILAGIQLGGEMVGIQMGFGISQTIDPLSGFSLPVISQLIYIVILLFFFTFNLHHYLIYFLCQSFEKIPPGGFELNKNLIILIIKNSRLIFELSVKFLSPLLIFMMLIYISMAIIARFIPQMNVIFVSFPLTIGLGLIFFGLMLVLLPRIIYPYFNKYFEILTILLKIH